MWVVLEDLLREVELELTLKDQREIKLEKKEKGISIVDRRKLTYCCPLPFHPQLYRIPYIFLIFLSLVLFKIISSIVKTCDLFSLGMASPWMISFLPHT